MKNNTRINEDYSVQLKELNRIFRISKDPSQLIMAAREFIAIIISDIMKINRALKIDIDKRWILNKDFLHDDFNIDIEYKDIEAYISEVLADDVCRIDNNTPSLCCLGKYLTLKEYMKSLLKFISYKYLGLSEIEITPPGIGRIVPAEAVRDTILSYATDSEQMQYLIENIGREVPLKTYKTNNGCVADVKGNFAIISNSEIENDVTYLQLLITSNDWKKATQLWTDDKNAEVIIMKLKKEEKQLREFEKANKSSLNKIKINEKQK